MLRIWFQVTTGGDSRSAPPPFGLRPARLVGEGPGGHGGRVAHLAPVVLDAVGQDLHLGTTVKQLGLDGFLMSRFFVYLEVYGV